MVSFLRQGSGIQSVEPLSGVGRMPGLGLSVAGGGAACTPHDQIDGSVSAGATFTHPADGVIAYTVDTLPSSGNIDLDFRVQDATNSWRVVITSATSVVLYEIVGGSPTQRGSSAGAVSAGDRIVVIADGTTIRIYVASSLEITYSSASNFQEETDGELKAIGTGGAVSDLKTWTLDCSGEEGV